MPNNAIRTAQFATAFITPTPPPTLPAWSARASDALKVIVNFRAAIRRWIAAGKIIDSELAAEYSRLWAAGLGEWIPAMPSLPAWSTRASRAIDALITLRSLAHKWAAAGSVNEAELAAVYELLEAAGLRGWLDDTLGGGNE